MSKAIRIHSYGGPEALRWEDVSVGEPAPGEIRLKQEAAGLNFIDIYYRTGLYKLPALPAVLGSEGAGIVDAVGDGVTDIEVGDRVAYAGPLGAYAEMRLLPADRAVPLPAAVPSTLAASILLQGMTAHYLLFDTFKVGPGTTLLLHAAAGGVGHIATQWAASLGATVIGTVGNAAKAAKVKALGASHVIDMSAQDFATEVKTITGGKGVDVVYDSVGVATFLGSLDCLRPRGLMVSFGQSSGAVAPFDPGLLSAKGSLYLTRPSLMAYVAERKDLLRRASDLFDAIGHGTLRIENSTQFALHDAGDAQKALEGRKTTGSVVLTI